MKNFAKTISEIEKYARKGKTEKVKNVLKWYKDPHIKSSEKNKIVYQVFVKEFLPLNIALTVINPGNINGEYFMTKGHIHKSLKEEFYVLLEGKGILFLQKGNKVKTIHLKKGELVLIEKSYAHRLINTGDKKLEVLTVYHEGSKPSYNFKFKKRFFKKK